MIKSLLFVIFVVAGLGFAGSARSAVTGYRLSGKVKSFDAKTVRVETDGRLMEFDIARVVDRKKLRSGQIIEIDLGDLSQKASKDSGE